MNDNLILLLASNSPRRKELLALGGLSFHAAGADVDETPLAGEMPGDYVIRLAQVKARALVEKAHGEQILIGSDTTVAVDNSILGKPADEAEAERMLKQLRGRTHQVYTGVAIYRARDEKMFTELCVTDVPMRAYSDDEIAAYIKTGDPLDKAGAYAIQHAEFNPVETMRGCYAGVMGLPLCHLARALKKMDATFAVDISSACQRFLKYECPVSSAILRGE